MEKMKVIKLEPDKVAEIIEIENTLEAKQEIVGGLVEVIHTFDDSVCIIANEEARCIGMDLNRSIKDSKGKLIDIFLGPAIICCLSETNFKGLTEEQISKYFSMFELPERFFRVCGEVVSVKYRPE